MSGPIFGSREAQPLDDMLAAIGEGWDGLDNLKMPEGRPVPLQPEDAVCKSWALLVERPGGRAMIEWLMDITLRLPLRSTGKTFEETALLTATRQGINGVGEAVLAAIKRGDELLQQERAKK